MSEENTETTTEEKTKPVKAKKPPRAELPTELDGHALVTLDQFAAAIEQEALVARALITYLLAVGTAVKAEPFKTPGRKGAGQARWLVSDSWANHFRKYE